MIWGSGSPLRQFIFSEDLAELMIWTVRSYDVRPLRRQAHRRLGASPTPLSLPLAERRAPHSVRGRGRRGQHQGRGARGRQGHEVRGRGQGVLLSLTPLSASGSGSLLTPRPCAPALPQFDTSKADGQYKKTASNKRLRDIRPDYEFTPIDEGARRAASRCGPARGPRLTRPTRTAQASASLWSGSWRTTRPPASREGRRAAPLCLEHDVLCRCRWTQRRTRPQRGRRGTTDSDRGCGARSERLGGHRFPAPAADKEWSGTCRCRWSQQRDRPHCAPARWIGTGVCGGIASRYERAGGGPQVPGTRNRQRARVSMNKRRERGSRAETGTPRAGSRAAGAAG